MELSEKVRLEIGVSEPLRRADGEGDPRGARARAKSATARSSCVPVEKVYRIRTGEEDQAAVTPVKMATT